MPCFQEKPDYKPALRDAFGLLAGHVGVLQYDPFAPSRRLALLPIGEGPACENFEDDLPFANDEPAGQRL